MKFINLQYWQVGLGYIFVVFLLFMIKSRGINKEKELIIASIRMTLQLIIVGHFLTLVFKYPNPFITFSIILVMVIFAIYTIISKFKKEISFSLKKIIALSMILGALPVVLLFMWLIIQIEPYYNPQYFIPITGMIIGNSMTGISLAVHTFVKGFTQNRNEIEELLILGATPKEASNDIINSSFDAAIMPTLNSMLGMGIIFLPGMMTGQILSGITPTMAILYQIAVMLGILGGVSLSSFLFLNLGYKTYFNSKHQLL